MYSQKCNCTASVPLSTFICLWAIYIFPGSVHIFSCSRIGRPIMGIYKSLTDKRMWKLGLRPSNFFSGIICFEFSVLCLCTAHPTGVQLFADESPYLVIWQFLMYYRVAGFLAIIRFGSFPHPPPFPVGKLSLFLSLPGLSPVESLCTYVYYSLK